MTTYYTGDDMATISIHANATLHAASTRQDIANFYATLAFYIN
jgi:hypothetical protein